ncbi:peptide/nickel transport system substrate-binding protein [Actinoplanes campanulatus]|uniref:Peptide/nickel transport system substrate-binding protein n=1 Tax=Actinoplanes campanulatus TaxID=113559 RepID=A0A7W5FJI1_9ACTN|nr:ABC transporter substrate-binding protein [Actinoplanes campanulatus]MBB3100647.1 peptide/nickel transport system substrate-binding protein [Actinoplanes campanulatus]GGN45687.1 peptide ABC transporter substrate-binding protein [Actinoplanes campanulatus]GID41106.1 peptide ABC transporter substrate-binding protein [Actinoplanes campanulatus]
MSIPSARRILAATAAALLLAGCTGADGEEKSGTADSSITVFNGANGAIVENWNPFSPTQLQPTNGTMYEALFWYNLANDAPPQPMLATGYSWNTDGTELTVTAREGVKWSDGQPFTAKDVAFTFDLIKRTKAINATNLDITSSVAKDDKTAVITFGTKSFTDEAAIIGHTPMIPEHIWSKIPDPEKTINQNPVGTGPFKLKSFSAQSFVIEKNPNYWQPGKPQIQNVRYISLATADAASAALTAGQVDWMSSYLPGLDQLLKNHKDLSYVNTPTMTTSIFTCAGAEYGCKGPQTDPAVRQAIYHAINRDQLNKLAGGGYAATASPTMLLPERDQKWIADPSQQAIPGTGDAAKANQILDAAGWAKGADGIRAKGGERLSMTIQTVSGWSDYISLNDTMAQQLKEVGIELKPTQLSWNEWNNNQVQGRYQLSLDSIGLGANSNPYHIYQPKYASGTTAKVGESARTSGNFARYHNDTVDKAIAVAAGTNDEAAQKEQYKAIQTEIVRDLPYIPIYVNSLLTEFNTSRATGWPSNDNKYALPASWKIWDNGIVLANITPAK